MKLILNIIVVFFLLLLPQILSSQNLYGVKRFYVQAHYSDDLSRFKNYVPTDVDLEKILRYYISNITFADKLALAEPDFAILDVNFDFFKNYDDHVDNVYYGSISIKLFRYFYVAGFKSNINANIFDRSEYFLYKNPSGDLIQIEFEKTINNLMAELKTAYDKDNI